MLRRVLTICAEDSPNVQRAYAEMGLPPSWPALRDVLRQVGWSEDRREAPWLLGRAVEMGLIRKVPSGEPIIPALLTWDKYVERRRTWDSQRQAVGLDATFYEGLELRLFPAEWLEIAKAAAAELEMLGTRRLVKGIGVDPGEGDADTAWAAVDDHGLVDLLTIKTPDTAVIRGETLAFMRKHNATPDMVLFDRGGGGLQIADGLRADGYAVRSLGFGESVVLQPKRSMHLYKEKLEVHEEKYAYINRRAQMYGDLSEKMNPANHDPDRKPRCLGRFAISARYAELLRQMALIPKTRDPEGRLKLPPKNKKDKDSDELTLTQIVGRSPDHLDALVLGVHAILHKGHRPVAGAAR